MEIPVLSRFASRLVQFLKREDGPTAVEYAVMLALIIVVCIAAISTLGSNASNTFSNVAHNVAAGSRPARGSCTPLRTPGRCCFSGVLLVSPSPADGKSRTIRLRRRHERKHQPGQRAIVARLGLTSSSRGDSPGCRAWVNSGLAPERTAVRPPS